MTGADMAAMEVPDKLSMVSYLSQFYEYLRKESIRPAKSKNDGLSIEVQTKWWVL